MAVNWNRKSPRGMGRAGFGMPTNYRQRIKLLRQNLLNCQIHDCMHFASTRSGGGLRKAADLHRRRRMLLRQHLAIAQFHVSGDNAGPFCAAT